MLFPTNEFEVLDYSIQHDGKSSVYIRFRIVPNGEGIQAELIQFRKNEMSDDEFDQETKQVQQNLGYLKNPLASSV